MVDTGLWEVLLSPGKTERMTLEQLDASFQSGGISAGTLIREAGSNDWKPLYEVAGLDPPPAPEPSRPAAGSAPRSHAGPPSGPPAPFAAAPSAPTRSRPAVPSPSEAPPPVDARSRPPALPPRRSGPPSKRTGRGVPLPSVPPRDEALNPLSPKPLTPPHTSSRRVSAPPSAPTSASGSRTRRAPPSILTAPVQPRDAGETISGLTRSSSAVSTGSRGPAARATAARPSEPIKPTAARAVVADDTQQAAGGKGAENASATVPQPQATGSSVVPAVPRSAPFAAPAPTEVVSPPAEGSSHNAPPPLRPPPLPDNAFAHLSGPPAAIASAPVVPTAVVAVSSPLPPAAPAPVSYGTGARSYPPASSPYPATTGLDAPAFPVGFDSPAGYSQPAGHGVVAQHYVPPGTNPWAPPALHGEPAQSTYAATDTTEGLVLDDRPSARTRLSKAEIALWGVAVLLAGTLIFHRNGVLRQWIGENPYTLLEAQLIGKPTLDTVAGVRAFLSEVGSGAITSEASPRR